MATGVDDVKESLQNLVGEASLSEIYDEVKRVRVDPLLKTWKASVRERVKSHSSDSETFNKCLGFLFFYF